MILYAGWEADPNQVAVKYHLNFGGGTDIYLPDVTYTVKGDTVDRPEEEPEREGYTFTGWYRDSACKQAWDFAKDKVPEDYADETLVLYAGWKSGPEQSETPENQGTQTGVNTGDSVNLVVWIISLVASAAAVILLWVKKMDKTK